MTAPAKTAFALLLLAGGFIAAKTFGPPDLAQRLVSSWRPSADSQWQGLRPAAQDEHRPDQLAPLDAIEMPAQFSAAYAQPSEPPVAAAFPPAAESRWPESLEVAASPPPAWTAPRDSGFQQSVYEEEMASLLPEDAEVESNVRYESPPSSGFQPFGSAPVSRPQVTPLDSPKSQPPGSVGKQAWPPFPAPATTAAPPPVPTGAPIAWAAANQPGDPRPPAQWASVGLDESQSQSPSRSSSQPTASPDRTHIVTDGDSLPKLAERYLGDAARSDEIFRENSSLLTHPDLLPLGVELQMPR